MTTSARVFIHPRCVAGPASAALAAHLQELGYDINKVVAGPPNARGRCELVRLLEDGPLALKLERMDGTQYIHKVGASAPDPVAA